MLLSQWSDAKDFDANASFHPDLFMPLLFLWQSTGVYGAIDSRQTNRNASAPPATISEVGFLLFAKLCWMYLCLTCPT
jgi:hypothetical protein